MIVVRSAGRLGNQLFVVAALRKIRRRREKLVLVGFEELARSFPELVANEYHIPLAREKWPRWKQAQRILKTLGFLMIISLVHEDSTLHRLARRRSILPVALFDGGFCQDEKLIEPDMWQELLPGRARATIVSALADLRFLPATDDKPVFFVHVRRGDYLTWPSVDFPAALPQSWYHEGIERIQDSHPHARFLVFSDDETFGARFALAIKADFAKDLTPLETLACMSMCTGGILSASSFSWWGAYLASQNFPGPFLAPLHWFTWAEGKWDNSHSLDGTSFVTWIPVIPSTVQVKNPQEPRGEATP